MLSFLSGWTWEAYVYEFFMVFCIGTAIFKLIKGNEPTTFDTKVLAGFCSLGFVLSCMAGIEIMVKKIDRIERAVNSLQNLQINQATRNIIIGKP